MPLHLAPNLDHRCALVTGPACSTWPPSQAVPARRRARRGRAGPASDVELRRLGAEVAGPGWRIEEAGGVRPGHIQVMRELGQELAGLADRLQRHGGRSPDDGEGGPVVPLRSGA